MIIGIEGALGKILAGKLSKIKDAELIGIDLNSNPSFDFYKYFIANIKDTDKIIEICVNENPDIIFNLAGIFGSDKKEEIFEINYYAPKRLIERLSEKKIKIILIGSAAEYGIINNQFPINEINALNPISDYGKSKADLSQFVLSYSKKNKEPEIIVGRIFNLIGLGINKNLFIGSLVNQFEKILAQEQIAELRVGNTDSYRDYLSIDLASDCLIALSNNGKSGEVYNICSGNTFKIDFILKEFINLLNFEVKINTSDNFKQSDPNYVLGNNSKISELIKISFGEKELKQEIKRIVESFYNDNKKNKNINQSDY